MLRYSLVLLIGLAGPAPVFAETWAEGLFPERAKDFGSVPRGTVLVHPFRIHNTTDAPVRVIDLRVSCGCVTARMEQPELAPGQSGTIVAEVHTDRFVGDKTVSINVLFDRPQGQEAVLQVRARSCDDVVLTPDVLDFGRGPRGISLKTKLTVTFPGHGAWQVLQASSDSEYVHVTLQEIPVESGRRYLIQATLDSDLGQGKWFTEVWLHTNHPWMERIRLPVRVVVEPLLTVTPASFKLEPPLSGRRVQRKVLIHGSTPFAILAVKGVDEHWSVRDETPGKAQQHVVVIALDGPLVGPQERSFQVVTDLPQGTVEIHARAEIGR